MQNHNILLTLLILGGFLSISVLRGVIAAPTPPIPITSLEVQTLADTQTDVDNLCSLREAIINANNDDQSGSSNCRAGTEGADVIDIVVVGIIVLNSSLPTIKDTLTINGNPAGTVINGADSYRIFLFDAVMNYMTLVLNDLTIEQGFHLSNGGGIYNESGNVEINRCSFLRNRATNGGAIHNGSGSINIVNSTFIENEATTHPTSSWGGAVMNGLSWDVTISNSTFKSNSATVAGSTLYNDTGVLVVYNSIIASGVNVDNCSGTVISYGNNIDTGTSCNFGSLEGSLSSTDPLLGSLGDNGGPTMTIPLQVGSPAIDGITFNSSNSSPNIDQRGYWRPVDGDGDTIIRFDIGAYEFDGFEFSEQTIFLPLIMK